jgi:hypothetical protein
VRRKLRPRPPGKAVREFERALRVTGCPDCGSRKTKVSRREPVPGVTLLHAGDCARRGDPFGGDQLAAAAARAVSLRYMASDGGGGGIVQDKAAP